MKKHYWLLVFLQGLIALALGLVAILLPGKTLVLLTWFVGAFLLFESVLLIIAAFWPGDKNGTTGILVFEGIIGLVASILIMSWPQVTLEVIFLLFAIWAIAVGIIGVVKVVFSKHDHDVNHSTLFSSLFKILVGFALLSFPQFTVSLVVIMFGLFIVITGLSEMVYSLKYKEYLDK